MNNTSLIADIEGYASVFHTRDMNGDIVAPGAFKASLARRASPVRMLYQHAADTPIGRWISFVEDRRGLFVRGEIILSSPKAREVHALLRGGALDGLSIGYQAAKARKGPLNGRRITEADLWEVSIVTFPMASEARITHIGPARECAQVFFGPPSQPAREGAHTENGSYSRPGRASGSPPTDVRHFADALRSAASIASTMTA
ncbi:Gene Transfer Agent prohead protease [hydrothermal vent metagenome]|uniref:Gene Transfer Agent prohead protease n=1 Tax=hydrothermal vent metagenome TaxID=652676 RepID=A0A3B0SDV4_9ZZZZ